MLEELEMRINIVYDDNEIKYNTHTKLMDNVNTGCSK